MFFSVKVFHSELLSINSVLNFRQLIIFYQAFEILRLF